MPIGPGDITTNLPYSPQAHLVFDHHLSETLRHLRIAPNHVIDPRAPSAARVVHDQADHAVDEIVDHLNAASVTRAWAQQPARRRSYPVGTDHHGGARP